MKEKKHILIIEDDFDLGRIVANCCFSIGHGATIVNDGKVGLEEALSGKYDLLILDVGLPTLGGFEVCERLRENHPHLPILMLTSRSNQADRIHGLELGADDYVTKPFDAMELTARVKALLRRSFAATEEAKFVNDDQTPVTAGDLTLDPKQHRVFLAGREIALTILEFSVLHYFIKHPGEAFTRDQLMEEVWGYRSSQFDGSVTKLLSRLRNRIESDPENPRYIKTVRGVGYRFASADELS